MGKRRFRGKKGTWHGTCYKEGRATVFFIPPFSVKRPGRLPGCFLLSEAHPKGKKNNLHDLQVVSVIKEAL